jgi:hypothetical protein
MESKGGEGPDNTAGDKGSINGDPMPIVIMDQVEEQVTEAAGDLTVEALAQRKRSAKMQRIWHRSSSNYR